MAKKKRPKKSPRKGPLPETTVELRVPYEVYKLAIEVYQRDAEALRSILIAVLGSDKLFGIDTVVLTSNEPTEEGEEGEEVRWAYQKTC